MAYKPLLRTVQGIKTEIGGTEPVVMSRPHSATRETRISTARDAGEKELHVRTVSRFQSKCRTARLARDCQVPRPLRTYRHQLRRGVTGQRLRRQFRPDIPPSEGHIGTERAKPRTAADIPPPARIATSCRRRNPRSSRQTYSVVVNEVPVKELLLALARDTKQNIDIHAGLTGLVSLNAINETLPAILERISKQVNMRYRTEGNTILVSADIPFLKTYVVNYVNIARKTASITAASGQISSPTGTSGASSAGGNSSSTSVTTTSDSDFWKILEHSVRSILNSSLQQSLSAESKQNRLELIKQEQDLRTKQMEAASKAGQSAQALATSLSGLSGGQQANSTLLPDDVIVNAVAGTITVNGTDKQHQMVQDYLTKVETGAQRQVLIEATIVEVQLSEAYQGGVDWSRLAISGGLTLQQVLTGGLAGAAAAAGAAAGNGLQVGYTNTNSRVGNISGSVKMLQEFGDTRVLSSPKLMVLNNQTALLKAVDNLVYFDIQGQTSTSATGPSLTTFTTTAKSIAVGLVMSVTPQINVDGRVLLTVRPTVSRQLDPVQDPNPSLCDPNRTNCIASLVPQIQVREMESVLQVGNGQIVVLGGLMQDAVQRNREQLPGADKLGAEAGEAFRARTERASKSELVIFLRPTVINNPSLESEELKFFQRFLPQPAKPPAEKTGAAP